MTLTEPGITEAEPAPAAELVPAADAAALHWQGTLLEIRPDQTSYTPLQRAALEAIRFPIDAPAPYVAAGLQTCATIGLDPLLGHATLYKIRGAWTFVIKFVGLKHLAERTGEYRGFEPVEFMTPRGEWIEGPYSASVYGGHPLMCRTGVRRGPSTSDYLITRAGLAWSEIAPLRDWDEIIVDGQKRKIWLPQDQWVLDPDWEAHGGIRLEKCTKARAIRDAWGLGVYTEEEMGRARVEAQRDDVEAEFAEQRRARGAAFAATAGGVVVPTDGPAPGMQRARDLMDGVRRRATEERTPEEASGLDAAYAAAHFPEPTTPAAPPEPDPESDPAPAAGPARTVEDYRRLLLAELDWQAGRLGTTVEELTSLQEPLWGGPVTGWEPDAILQIVATLRGPVADLLAASDQPQDRQDANRYRMAASDDVGTLAELLGRADAA